MPVETCESNGITLAYETFGDRDRPPLLLIQGLGQQMLGFHHEFCRLLARHRFVVRFDNRDVGESTHLDGRKPDLAACYAGDTSSAVYTIDDMALDAVGLLEALSLDSAHLVGVSLGGMIAQTIAAKHRERARSLTSIMSTTGARQVSQPTEEASAILVHPVPRNPDEAGEWAVREHAVLGSPAYPVDEQELRERGATAWKRSCDPAGFVRQLAAILASGNRTEAVRTIDAPTLVIHGEDDPLLPLAGGRATAEAIDGAELVVIPGMGHNLPRQLWPELAERIVSFGDRVEQSLARA